METLQQIERQLRIIDQQLAIGGECKQSLFHAAEIPVDVSLLQYLSVVSLTSESASDLERLQQSYKKFPVFHVVTTKMSS